MSPEWLFTQLLSTWLLPPLNFLTVIGLGLAVTRRRRGPGLFISCSGLSILAALSTGAIGNFLISTLESTVHPISAFQVRSNPIGAIIILGGGIATAPEYGAENVSPAVLGRIRYGVRLAREYHLPLLVTGGKPDGAKSSEADVMARTLEQEYEVTPRWLEGKSINTIQNAQFSAQLLKDSGVTSAILVTDAWHMPRSVERFRSAGLVVVPGPTNYLSHPGLGPIDFLPTADGLRKSSIAFHEWIGILVSRARGV